MKMEEIIKDLKEQISQKQQEIRELHWTIEKFEAKELLPVIKQRYEGKYWKYENGFNKEEHWFLYSYCHEVTDANWGIFTRFEINTCGECEHKVKQVDGLHLCATEITKDEFMAEFKKFIDPINHVFN